MSALTKILIVLQLVFSVAVSVLLVLMVSRQEDYRGNFAKAKSDSVALSAQVLQALNDKQNLQAQVSDAQKVRDTALNDLSKLRGDSSAKQLADQNSILTLQGDASAQKTQIAGLSAALATANSSIAAKDKELTELRPQVGKLTTDYNELARKFNEDENKIRADEQAIRKLQEQLVVQAPAGAASGGGGGQVAALTALPTSGAVNAKVSSVLESAGRTLIEMPLGTRDGIRQNTPMFIYRSTGYVADAIVERVTADTAVAVITKTKSGEVVQAGDTVSTIGR